MGLVSGDSEMALRQFHILNMREHAISLVGCLCVTKCKKSIIILQKSGGRDLERIRSKGRQFAIICKYIINKRLTFILQFVNQTISKPFQSLWGEISKQGAWQLTFWRCSEYRFCMTVWIKEWLSLLLSCSHLCLLSLCGGQQEFPPLIRNHFPAQPSQNS